MKCGGTDGQLLALPCRSDLFMFGDDVLLMRWFRSWCFVAALGHLTLLC